MKNSELSIEQHRYLDTLYEQLTEQMDVSSFRFEQYSALRIEVQNLVLKYFQLNEACYLEEAYLACYKYKILVPVLLDEITKLFLDKRCGEHIVDRKKKSSVKPQKEAVLYQACVAIAKLEHLCGLTRKDACERVAALLDMMYPQFTMKGSSLDKKQKEIYPDLEIKRMLNYVPDGWSAEQKNKYLSHFPVNIPQALKADNRR
ncbi:hypothetical protein L2744_18410 [Shewanella profunda]|uniref:hypothetical protein n=1 Tax=Shewanella profunda TaxID=254793 RepID=UPI00200E4002|nr:hypothetical protein [Shewanella profunda]MCL1091535.1 hypothetical protein [Shewanella profunda]